MDRRRESSSGKKPLLWIMEAIGVLVVLASISFYLLVFGTRGEILRDNLREHVRCLASPRPAGSSELETTDLYVEANLTGNGYTVHRQKITLPAGGVTQNIWADKRGASDKVILFAAHLDTVADCPGANDDGTGVALLLEMARVFRDEGTPATLRFAFFGAEEEIHGYEGHGFGSTKYADSLTAKERSRIARVFWLDKLGRGPRFKILHIEGTRSDAFDLAKESAHKLRLPAKPKTVKRWSDQMAFEDLGIPTAWVEWGPDPELHKPSDTPESVDLRKVRSVALLAGKLARMAP